MLVILEPLTSLIEQLLESFTLFDVKEVEVVVWICHIVEPKIGLEVLAPQKLLTSTDLVEELVQHCEVVEVPWNLEALKREVLVSTIGNDLEHARLVLL